MTPEPGIAVVSAITGDRAVIVEVDEHKGVVMLKVDGEELPDDLPVALDTFDLHWQEA